MENHSTSITETQMKIRKPVDEVFNAFVDPLVTRNFWFSKSSGMLEEGITLTWEWEMYSVKTLVSVVEVVKDERIVFVWGEKPRKVEILFQTLKDRSTYVQIKESGYDLAGDSLVEAIKNSTGGFTTVLDGLKAYLEHGINLNLISDKFP